MKKFSKKSVLLFAGAMAVCAFVMPSMASAASWGVVGSHHTLDSPSLGYSTSVGLISPCTNSSLTARVDSAQVLTITTVTFAGCTTTVPAMGADCTTTWIPNNLPWRATAVTMTSIQVHGIHFTLTYEDMPGRPTSCGSLKHDPFAFVVPTTLTGTLSGGHWSGNGTHEIVWTNGTGLTNQFGSPVSLVGTFRDTQQTLTVQGDGC